MDSIIRNVTDIDPADRQALEHVLGQQLQASQQIVITVKNIEKPASNGNSSKTQPVSAIVLPPWCHVYGGLIAGEVDEIEKSIIRNPGSRSFDGFPG